MNKEEHLKRIKRENAWRDEWITWMRAKDMLTKDEMHFCRGAYYSGWKAGMRSIDANE